MLFSSNFDCSVPPDVESLNGAILQIRLYVRFNNNPSEAVTVDGIIGFNCDTNLILEHIYCIR